MHGVVREMVDVGNVHFDRAILDELKEVRGIVDDTERRGNPERAHPWLQLLHLRVLVVSIELHHVVGQNSPEGIDDLPAQPGSMKKAPHARVAIGVSPDTRTEPGQEASGDQLLEPFLQWCDVRRCHPDGTMAGFANDPVNLHARSGAGVRRIPGGLGSAENSSSFASLEYLRLILEGITAVEERSTEFILTLERRQVCLGGDARGDDQLLRVDNHGVVTMRHSQLPGTIEAMLGALDAVVQSHAVTESESLDICFHIPLNDVAGNVLARTHTEGSFIHGKVTELVRAQHVIRLEALVQAMLGPYSTDGAGSLQQKHITVGIDLAVGLDSRESTPAWNGMLVGSPH